MQLENICSYSKRMLSLSFAANTSVQVDCVSQNSSSRSIPRSPQVVNFQLLGVFSVSNYPCLSAPFTEMTEKLALSSRGDATASLGHLGGAETTGTAVQMLHLCYCMSSARAGLRGRIICSAGTAETLEWTLPSSICLRNSTRMWMAWAMIFAVYICVSPVPDAFISLWELQTSLQFRFTLFHWQPIYPESSRRTGYYC